jgi:hypothetical protein
MGWGDYFPGRVENHSKQAVYCLVSNPKGWNYHVLDAGYQSHPDIDVDGVKHANGTFILELSSALRSASDTWLHLSGMWGHLDINNNDSGKEPRIVIKQKGDVDLWTDKFITDNGGAPVEAPWPPGNLPKKL